jgi:uncharacterized membrane protein
MFKSDQTHVYQFGVLSAKSPGWGDQPDACLGWGGRCSSSLVLLLMLFVPLLLPMLLMLRVCVVGEERQWVDPVTASLVQGTAHRCGHTRATPSRRAHLLTGK